MTVRRQLAPVVLVLALTVGGFFVSRAHGEQDARQDSAHRADIAATQVHDRVTQATTLVDGVRRFLAGHLSPGVTTEQFGDIGSRWLGPVGLPSAAWVERVPAGERASYERRTGHRIVAPTRSGGLSRSGARESYLPATLVTGIPPMSVPGIDLGGTFGVAAAVARPDTAYRVSATPLGRLRDRTAGLFLVQSAQRVSAGGIVEPGFVVLFVPASWLVAAAADTAGSNPSVRITAGGVSSGNLRGASAGSTFTAAGETFDVRVPLDKVTGNAEVLPWIILAGGLVLAALAGALGVISSRRTKAQAELDRLFNISPDLIVVAGFDGYFKRVNPAFEALLGYTEQEALSRPYVEFVHPDDRQQTESESSHLREGETTIAFENRYVCKDGSVRWIEWTARPVPEEQLIYAVARDVTERRKAVTDLREAEERNRALAEEQAALRRVATLVAEGVPPARLFSAVCDEVNSLVDAQATTIGRLEPDEKVAIVAITGAAADKSALGARLELEALPVTAAVVQTGRPARREHYGDVLKHNKVACDRGIRSGVGVPIVVEGALWGAIGIGTVREHFPDDTEQRLEKFTELAATAIANAESRAALARLAAEQAALRRVATLVAEGVPPAEVFAAIVEEVSGLLDAHNSAIARLEVDGKVTIVGNSGLATESLELGSRLKPEPGWVLTAVIETGCSARKDDYETASGGMPGISRGLGIRSSIAAPIVVEGALWGVIILGTGRARFADGTERRLEAFTELAATAIANAESRSELAASRARIVTAADEARRQIERDLHDGTQQRLVSLALALRVTESKIPAELDNVRAELSTTATGLAAAVEDLQEISRGIHPAILSRGGLVSAVETLAHGAAVPVEIDARIDRRLPESIEVAAYYVVSEALTNVAKHANASMAQVVVTADDSAIELAIRDDGVGGADPARGSGLIGLRDRVEALGGTIEIVSCEGDGTSLLARIPTDQMEPFPEGLQAGRVEGADGSARRETSTPVS